METGYRINGILESIVKASTKLDPKTVIYLAGSYARDSATKRSDIDLLIIHNDKELLKNVLIKELKIQYPVWLKKLDVTILNHNELNLIYGNDYVMFLLNISYGKCLTDNPINIKFKPLLLRKELDRLRHQLIIVDELINKNQDYEMIAGFIFSIGKMLCFMETIINGTRQPLKNLFKENLRHLGKCYEQKISTKGIKTTFSKEIKIYYQKKTKKEDFSRLFQTKTELREYLLQIEHSLDRLINECL